MLTPESKRFHANFILSANGSNITEIIKRRLISLRYTDEVGFDSDMLEIVLADDDEREPIALPPKGAELTFGIGYHADVRKVGLFVVDEIEVGGWPATLTIRARAAVYEASKGGKADLQSQKSRTWAAGTTLGAMVRKIAAEHGLGPVVSPVLSSIALPHVDQTDESDLNLLLRLARKYDAAVKPAGGKLVLSKRGAGTTADGKPLPRVFVSPDETTQFRMVISSRETAGTVVAYYHAVKQSKRHEVKAGSGEPVRRIKQYYPTQAMALAAARADLQRRERGMKTISLTMPGNYDLVAEGVLVTAGFRPGLDQDWLIRRVEHSLDAGGWVSTVEGEDPNDVEATEDAASAA